MYQATASPDFRLTASWPNLRLRAELLRRLREFFHVRGFLEVETPILSADTVVDRHLEPFCVDISGDNMANSPHPNPLPEGEGTAAGHPRRMWLQTSPEFAMKRLLAAGGQAIYQVSRVFRREELGPWHNPEFTMVEWYRTGDGMSEGMQLTSDFCETLLGAVPRNVSPMARHSDNTLASIRIRPTAASWRQRPGPAASSRRQASARTTATVGSIC